jgi:4-amino-4-deoxy-L-arabinose transferase
VRRAVSPDLTQQPQPWWFYGAVFPAGAMLWTLAWPNAAKGLRGAREWRDGVRFLLCWAIVPILALSLSGGKLATYVLPMFAPVSVLVAMGLVRGREAGSIVRDVPARIGQALVWLAAGGCVVLAAAGTERFGLPTPWESGASARFACLAAALAAWALADGWSWRASDGPRWLARTAIAPVAVLAMVPFLYPTAALKAAKHPWPFLERHRDALCAVDVLVVAGGSPALATSWTTGRRDLVIAGWADEFDNELNLPEELPRRIGWEDVAARATEARAAVPPKAFAVLCDTPAAERLLAMPGLSAPTVQDADRDLTVMFWR